MRGVLVALVFAGGLGFLAGRESAAAVPSAPAEGTINCGGQIKPICPPGQRAVCMCSDYVRSDCVWVCG